MNTKKIKPALYRLEGLPWAWVKLRELSEVVGRSPTEVCEDFWALSKDIDVLAISDGQKMENVLQSREIAYSGGDYFRGEIMFVPAGWALDVIKAVEDGAVQVVLVQHEHLGQGEPCPEGTLNCTFNGHAFTAAVGLKADGNPVWSYDECDHSEGTVMVDYLNPCESAGCDLHSGEHRNCGQQRREICVRCGAVLSDTADTRWDEE